MCLWISKNVFESIWEFNQTVICSSFFSGLSVYSKLFHAHRSRPRWLSDDWFSDYLLVLDLFRGTLFNQSDSSVTMVYHDGKENSVKWIVWLKFPKFFPSSLNSVNHFEVYSVRNLLFHFFHWSYKSTVDNKQGKRIATSLRRIISPNQLLYNPKQTCCCGFWKGIMLLAIRICCISKNSSCSHLNSGITFLINN